MKKIAGYFDKVRFPDWSIPIALLAVCGLAFGLLLPKLGFYQDDWHFVYYAYTRGAAGLTELLNYDGHPLAAPLYIASFKLLGFSPLNWQIFSLFWRWLAVATFWLVLHRIWPEQRRVTFTAAAIYIIYPLFTMQAMAVVYFEVWISHFLLAASFLLTIEALKQPKRFWLFTILAILLKLLHTFSSEYTWGMELARPVLIWLALPAIQNESFLRRLGRTAQIYAPYLIVSLPALIWRGFLYNSPVSTRSDPRLWDAILTNPIGGISHLIFNAIPDLLLILISTWFQPLDPKLFILADRFNLQVVGLMLISAAGLGVYLSRLEWSGGEKDQQKPPWMRQALIFGAAVLVFGMMPVYAAGYFVFLKLDPWNGRFVIGSMPGIALLTSLFIEALLDTPKKRLVAAALIISLGIGWQVRKSNEFRHAWEAETNFYRQLTLRAPSITPHTAFIAQDEFLGLMGDYPTSFALNTIYAEPLGVSGQDARTWLFIVSSNFGGRVDGLLSGMPLVDKKHSTEFTGKSSDSLVMMYEPELDQCLWVITPEAANAQIVPETLRVISPLSNTRLIDTSAAPTPFLQTILPSQPDNWCAYYQRGSLALQLKEWDQAVSLWEKAAEKGLRPANGFEYLPFIEAYGMTGNWPQAFELTRTANKSSKSMESALCTLWSRLQKQTATSPEQVNAVAKVKDYLGCR